MTEQNYDSSEDPNSKLKSLLVDIDAGINKLDEKTWQDSILARTKKVRPSIPITFYRNDREVLGKINLELEKKWGHLSSTQDEKSYLDLIQIFDKLIEWIITG